MGVPKKQKAQRPLKLFDHVWLSLPSSVPPNEHRDLGDQLAFSCNPEVGLLLRAPFARL